MTSFEDTITNFLKGVGIVATFFLWTFWSLLLFLIAKAFDNKIVYIIVLMFFAFCIIYNLSNAGIHISTGSDYGFDISAVVPEIVGAYLVYKSYRSLQFGFQRIGTSKKRYNY